MIFLVSELSVAVSDTLGGDYSGRGVRARSVSGNDIEITDVRVKHFRQCRHVSETALLNSDTREGGAQKNGILKNWHRTVGM